MNQLGAFVADLMKSDGLQMIGMQGSPDPGDGGGSHDDSSAGISLVTRRPGDSPGWVVVTTMTKSPSMISG
jgi:hypothetical protein